MYINNQVVPNQQYLVYLELFPCVCRAVFIWSSSLGYFEKFSYLFCFCALCNYEFQINPLTPCSCVMLPPDPSVHAMVRPQSSCHYAVLLPVLTIIIVYLKPLPCLFRAVSSFIYSCFLVHLEWLSLTQKYKNNTFMFGFDNFNLFRSNIIFYMNVNMSIYIYIYIYIYTAEE